MEQVLTLSFIYDLPARFPVWGTTLFFFLIIWSFVWKGLALWHSAQRGGVWWFVAFILINTVGVLEIIYLFAVVKLKFNTLFSSRIVAFEKESTQ